MKNPAAFISYARRDDAAYGGRITGLRKRLQRMVASAIGRDFEIFQDCEGIAWGQHWRSRLDEALEEALFLIPILTPSYFNSEGCRAELETFLELERRSGRNDRILSLYFLTAPVYEHKKDALATLLSERQHRDWRHLRIDPVGAPRVMRALDSLAGEIAHAIHARQEDANPPATLPDAAVQAPAPAIIPPVPPESGGTGLTTTSEERSTVLRRTEICTAHPSAKRAELKEAPRLVEFPCGHLAEPSHVYCPICGRLRDDVVRASSESTLLSRSEIPPPGTVFRDIGAPWCPEMVVIPPGEFMMGSTEAERQWALDQGAKREWVEREKPQHSVRIAYPLAVSRYPATFEEYGHFARSTGRAQPDDQGWGRGRRPVINVDWEDAEAFIAWLSVQTGQGYRLPSEAEWEYACRAGTTSRYWWGDEITPENANFGSALRRTSEVGEYPANPFGLYDMHGNVWEWVEDRWHHSYEGAPDDGSAWTTGNSSRRVLRGGAWSRNQAGVRSASRTGKTTNFQESKIGFRVARTLTP